MAIASEHRLWTFADFCERVPEGLKADLLEGVIFVASPDNIEHHDIGFWLGRLFSDYLEAMKIGGRLFSSRVAFRLSDADAPEPDLAYVCPERVKIIRKSYVAGPPDLAVEIISPDSVERDYEKKRAQYEQFGVAEYWIIDPLERKMTCYHIAKDGKYKEVRPRKGVIASEVIPGFWVRPTWFWQSPLPSKDETLREIMQSVNGKA